MPLVDRDVLVPYLISNGVGLGLLVLAGARPRLARALIVVGFVGAAAFNAWTALRAPASYLGFAASAWPPYPWLIEHVVARAPAAFVLLIAAGQLGGALLLRARDRARARLGARLLIGFLIAIAPLGVGAAFPSSLLMAAAVWRVGRVSCPAHRSTARSCAPPRC